MVYFLYSCVCVCVWGGILVPWLGFRASLVGKESACNAGHPGSTPASGRSAGEWTGYPLQYSWAFLAAHLVKNMPAVRETWVRSLGWEDPLEKKRLLTPVFCPGEFHGLHSAWGRKESDMTERLSLSLSFLTRGQTCAICSGSSQSLDHQGIPRVFYLNIGDTQWLLY